MTKISLILVLGTLNEFKNELNLKPLLEFELLLEEFELPLN